MSEETQEMDLIEDIVEEQLIANEELEQDLPEVSEGQEVASFSDSIKSILLGEKKAVKENDEEEEDEEEDEEDEEEEEEEEMDESVQDDDEAADKETIKNIKKSTPKKAPVPKGGSPKTDEKAYDGQKAAEDAAKTVKESLNLLIDNEAALSEDFKTQASTLFEAALAEKSVQIKESLEAKYNQELNEEVETLREGLITKIDNYLNYVVESWIEENTQQVETTLRSEIAENFMSSLKDLFVESYIEVPAEKRDIVEELNAEFNQATDQLAEAEIEIQGLKEEIETYERAAVLDSLAEGLSENEFYRLKTIVEDVEFIDKSTFEKKVSTIKGSIFESQELPTESVESLVEEAEETEIIIEGESKVKEPVLSGNMAHYVKALSK